jgi:DNA-binding beta-propeller fold protein YncE
MTDRCTRREFLALSGTALSSCVLPPVLARLERRSANAGHVGQSERHLLYVAEPGIRNYVEWGGIGVLVYDIADGFRLVRRIATLTTPSGESPEPIKGICASAATGKLYVSTPRRLLCIHLRTDALLWSHTYEAGCDRMSITPDGATIYLPSFEGPLWYVVDAATGDEIARVVTNSGAHNTICGPSGTHAYLAGLRSPLLRVADTRSRTVVREVGPFSNVIRPFTIDGAERRCFVNVNELLGFEVGDLQSGKMLHRVEVPKFTKGPVKRHGCPSHGIAMTPDEREVWVSDGANSRVHMFDGTVMPPRYVQSIVLRDQPGWITLTIDGTLAIPSTGEVIDTRSKQIVAALADEAGRPVQSEKLLEVVTDAGTPLRAGDQFAIGGHRERPA